MIRPRWQALKPQHGLFSWRRWDQAIAVIAAVNLTWVAIDLTYIPLRNFWLQRNLYPVPSLPLVVPLPWLPDITPWLDPSRASNPIATPRLTSRPTGLWIGHCSRTARALLKALLC